MQQTNAPLPATQEEMVGPYYPPRFLLEDPARLDKALGLSVRPEGEPIVLSGAVLDLHGKPVAPILVEFWQADASGKLRVPGETAVDPWFDGYARQYCTDGSFELRTVKPGAVSDARAPHVTVTLFCDGVSRLVTQVFFDDEPANARDPLLLDLPEALRDRLIARRQPGDGPPRYLIDIVMRGERETPFFDDLES